MPGICLKEKPGISVPGFAQYMEDMKFKAEWKRGVELRPVKAFRELSDHLILTIMSPENKRLARVFAHL